MVKTWRWLLGKKKNKLYYIEIDDERLNKEITSIIVHMEQEIKQFRKTIDETTWVVREEELQQLYKEMTHIKDDVMKIEADINKIVGLKLHNLKYFIIRDDSYLVDKKQDLKSMRDSIHSFLEVIEARPGKQDLKKELLEGLLKQLTIIEKETRKLISDDISLQHIYRKMNST